MLASNTWETLLYLHVSQIREIHVSWKTLLYLPVSQIREIHVSRKAYFVQKDIIYKRACYSIGNRNNINFWVDSCIPSFPLKRLSLRDGTDRILTVANLKGEETHDWNYPLLTRLCSEAAVAAFTKIKWPSFSRSDKLCWIGSARRFSWWEVVIGCSFLIGSHRFPQCGSHYGKRISMRGSSCSCGKGYQISFQLGRC